MDADYAAGRRAAREWILRLASSLVVLAAFVGGGLYHQQLSGKTHDTADHHAINSPARSK